MSLAFLASTGITLLVLGCALPEYRYPFILYFKKFLCVMEYVDIFLSIKWMVSSVPTKFSEVHLCIYFMYICNIAFSLWMLFLVNPGIFLHFLNYKCIKHKSTSTNDIPTYNQLCNFVSPTIHNHTHTYTLSWESLHLFIMKVKFWLSVKGFRYKLSCQKQHSF